jgi:hypothetical protein
LIERQIARCRRVVSVEFRCEIEVGLARHHDMHSIMQRRDREFVGGIQSRLRGDELPGANAGVFGVLEAEIRDSKLNGGDQCEQREFKN